MFSHARRSMVVFAWRRAWTPQSRRWMAAILCLTAVLPPFGVVAEPAAAKSDASAVCPVEKADEAVALAADRSCGGKVQVADATSESSMTWANADGSLSTQVDGGPVRYEQD